MSKHVEFFCWTMLFCVGAFLVFPKPAIADDRLEQALNLHQPGQDATEIDARYRWLHWWEAHRPTIFRQAHSTPPSSRSTINPEVAERVGEQLLAALEHDAPQVRYGALLALARMEHPRVVELVLEDEISTPTSTGEPLTTQGLIDDPEALVRQAAWVTLGLTADSQSRSVLTDRSRDERSEIDTVGRMTGLGLLPSANRRELAELVHAIEHGSTDEVRRMAIWALAQHDQPDTDRLIAAVVQNASNPTLTEQALAYASAHQRLRNEVWRTEIAEQRRRGREITAINALAKVSDLDIHGSTPERLEMELQTAALASLASQGEASDTRALRRVTQRLAQTGNNETLITANGPRRAGIPTRFEQLNQLHMLRGQATLTLATLTDEYEQDMETLLRLLKGETQGVEFDGDQSIEQQLPDALVRGYAALGLGILSRRNDASAEWTLGTPVTDHRALRGRDQREIVRELAKLLDRRNEPALLRSAVAMGLGFTGHPEAIENLRRHASQLHPGDQLLGGYLALGLAIADDPAAVPLAENLLSMDRDDFATILSQRAAAQALGFIGDTAAVRRAWAQPDRPMWVQLELARTTAEIGAEPSVTPLLNQLNDSDADRAWIAACALGEMLDAEPQPRFHRLGRHVNHTTTFRQHSFVNFCHIPGRFLIGPAGWPIRDFHGLSQPFLYFNLLTRTPGPIPSPGEAGTEDAAITLNRPHTSQRQR